MNSLETVKPSLHDHIAFLSEKIFQTKTKWPHFQKMIEDIVQISQEAKENSDVVVLERAYVYGGDSLFAALFDKQKVTVVDCEIKTTKERDGYQKSWTNDSRYLRVPSEIRAPIENTGLPSQCADLVLVPNVVHHVSNQEAMFAEIARLLKVGGTGYIFEALIRELHQIPDDYVRYTPWGFKAILARHGLEMTSWHPAGGPFEAISYCWIQALQYIPENERREKEDWFFNKHLPELLEMDQKFTKNQVRPHTSFPVGYSVFFKRVQ